MRWAVAEQTLRSSSKTIGLGRTVSDTVGRHNLTCPLLIFWYDPHASSRRVTVDRFGKDLVTATETAIGEPLANFADEAAQGSAAYAATMVNLHPDGDIDALANDAVAAVPIFGGCTEVVRTFVTGTNVTCPTGRGRTSALAATEFAHDAHGDLTLGPVTTCGRAEHRWRERRRPCGEGAALPRECGHHSTRAREKPHHAISTIAHGRLGVMTTGRRAVASGGVHRQGAR